MDNRLKVNKADLENSKDDWSYLYVILNKYNELLQGRALKFPESFNDDQLALFVYRTLDAEVTNGGFLQLIFNRHASYIFESSFMETLKLWGAISTAGLLESIKSACLQIAEELKIAGQFDEQRSMEGLSNLYEKHPEFDEYDSIYYKINKTEIKEIKNYIACHLSDFIIVG